MKIDKGFKFRGLHNFHDIGLVMPTDPQIRFPSKIKNKLRIPGTNKIYTRNTTAYTQELTEVVIKCALNIIDFEKITIERTHELASVVLDWLMTTSEREMLELDILPGWYYMAEVETVGDFETGFFEYGILEVEFTGYPYKIRKASSANTIWDEVYFPSDYIQETEFKLLRMEDQLPFVDLNVGDIVHLGGWSQFFGSSFVDAEPYKYRKAYEITAKRNRTGGADPSNLVYGAREYQLDKIAWVAEQDIIEARSKPIEITLHNTSAHPIFPEIEIYGTDRIPGVTIVKDELYLNYSQYAPRPAPGSPFVKQEIINDRFRLVPGDNTFKVYGQYVNLDFIWHAEVL